jgi:predicted transcriptional regulator
MNMTTVTIKLPDELAREAEQAGLLVPESMERILRDQLKAKRVDALFAAMERMSAVDDPPYMSPEEVAEEIKKMRAERRTKVA